MLGAGGGGGRVSFWSRPISVGGGGVGAAKSLLPSFLVPKGNQPTACTLALWWLKFGPTERYSGGGGSTPSIKARFGTGRGGNNLDRTNVICTHDRHSIKKPLHSGVLGITVQHHHVTQHTQHQK